MENSGAYGRLAEVYDRLNAEVDYVSWAEFIQKCFQKYADTPPSLVLDLACGTGRMTYALERMGYDMIGVDGSDEMLSEAMQSCPDDARMPLFLMQDMRCFELYGTVGAVVCCLDSINYLTEDGDMEACFKTVCNYLDPGGVFVFDVSTPYRFSHIFGRNCYVLEDEETGTYCGWQNYYDPESGLCDFLLTVFELGRDGKYSRFDEQQTERCYTREQIFSALKTAGLVPQALVGNFGFESPSEDADRWYIVAKKPAN